MDKKLKATEQRAIQYWFADGLTELSGGVICLLLTIYFIIQQLLPASQAAFALFFLALFVIVFGIRKLVLRYRERNTYPRTGYVEPKKRGESRMLLVVEIGFTLSLLGFMLFTILRGIQTVDWTPVLGGLVFGFIFGLAGYQTKLVRFYFLAIFCSLLGIVLSFSEVGDLWGAALLSLVTGLVLFAFGMITRLDYLRQSSGVME